MSKRDYYEILGVDKGADEKTMKSAFRKKAMGCHPDRHPDDPEAEARFKELNEAYGILSDSQKRAAYDRMGHRAFEQGGAGGAGGFQDFGDIFSQIFGGGAGRVRTQQGFFTMERPCSTEAPGSAPIPSQRSQSPAIGTLISISLPPKASSNVISIS